MLLQTLESRKLIHPPKWLSSNCHYLTYMGSIAYGVSEDFSDLDVYGWCIPNKEDIFPHLRGEIPGFGRQIQKFDQWIEHHVAWNEKVYDFQVFSIVKYFQLAMENNPNMIDSLFTPRNCVFHITQSAERLREKRKIFLHKGIYHKLKGYAYSQMNKLRNKQAEGKRLEYIEKFGYDVKFAYHVVRLINQAEQVLEEHDLDLTRNKDQLKAIRRGEWKEQDIYDYFQMKEKHLEDLYTRSTLQHSPNENLIKQLLLECLEAHYGSIDNCIVNLDKYEVAIQEIKNIVGKL